MLFPKSHGERLKDEILHTEQAQFVLIRNLRSIKWQGRIFSGLQSCVLHLERLCQHLLALSPRSIQFQPLNSILHNKASPKLTLMIGVHGSICFAAKVLREFVWIGDGADNSKSWWTVRICDYTLMWALRCPNGAPYLQNDKDSKGYAFKNIFTVF